jgi:putative transposase
MLSKSKENYQKSIKWNLYEYKKLLPELKEQYPFLKEVNSQSLQQAVVNLNKAFKNFFAKKSDFPTFKKKKNGGAIYIPQHFRIEQDKLYIPKLNTPIKTRMHRPLKGDVKSITIRNTPSGKYYASILVDKEIKQLKTCNSAVAIDVGIKSFATMAKTSLTDLQISHEKFDNLKLLRKTEKRLKRLQKQLSSKQYKTTKLDNTKASNNYKKCVLKVAKQSEKVANKRRDFLHKLSKTIIDENQVIVVEDLNIKGMLKNHHLAKSISDSGWDLFKNMLKYKAKWYGRTLIEIDRFFPSSKTCHVCGYKNTQLTLSDRYWICPQCHTYHDRDCNASDMLLYEGLRIAGFSNLLGQELSELTPVEIGSVDDRSQKLSKKHPIVEAGSSPF